MCTANESACIWRASRRCSCCAGANVLARVRSGFTAARARLNAYHRGLRPRVQHVGLIAPRGAAHPPGGLRSAAFRLRGDRREEIVARLLAATTDLGTEPTVLVMGGVPLALLGTGEAGRRTGFDHRTDEAEIRLGLACDDTSGCVAGVGAVEAEANAAGQLADVVLGEIGVGTTGTAGRAVKARVDTAQERLAIEAGLLWMQFDDLAKGHSLSSRSGAIALREALPPRTTLGRWRLTCLARRRRKASCRPGGAPGSPPRSRQRRRATKGRT